MMWLSLQATQPLLATSNDSFIFSETLSHSYATRNFIYPAGRKDGENRRICAGSAAVPY